MAMPAKMGKAKPSGPPLPDAPKLDFLRLRAMVCPYAVAVANISPQNGAGSRRNLDERPKE